MITRLDLRGTTLDKRALRGKLPRTEVDLDSAGRAVASLVEQVRVHGRTAVLDFTERFDLVRPERLRVTSAALGAALEDIDPAVLAALRLSIERQRLVSTAQLVPDHTTAVADGASITERRLPVDRVGLYVPGGLAVYPSTVVMNVVPAQVAGVGSLAIASPPGPDGLPHPTVLAAAALLGVEEVWAMGGAQAVAAFAFGFSSEEETLEAVDLITGPGNAYVAAAKSQVRGVVGIDAVAGPTEIIVLADGTARADYVAADLISQAEHDPQAASVLVTADEALLEAVAAELELQVPRTPHTERVSQALAGRQSALVLVDDLDAGIRVVNAYAGEHVEVLTADAESVAARVTHGGAVFIGEHSPVSLGDYCAGSNHVLPTMGTAAFSSGLSVASFQRASQVINYDRPALEAVAAEVSALANAEDLPAHGAAVAIRFRQED